MYAKIRSGTLRGIDAEIITVETDIAFGFPSLSIVGLPDTAVRESRERVRTAIVNSGYTFPDRRVTVNLSPADIRKEGSHLDLPIAVSILSASGAVKPPDSRRTAFLGELTLDGKISRIKGALPLILGLKENDCDTILVPSANRGEAQLVKGLSVYCVSSLKEVADFLNGKDIPERIVPKTSMGKTASEIPDFADVSGQQTAKRVLTIAAAAMHNVLLSGPPGSGKTMLARRVPGIMPPLTYEESLEITRIYSSCGLLSEERPLITERPFRSPDHTLSAAAMIGGGVRVRPGEVTLAHLGILFLDELPEFSRGALEAMRRPMEDEFCTISRLSGSVTFPSRFLLIAAMNPCPCGYFGCGAQEGMTPDSGSPAGLYKMRTCVCTGSAIARYRRKISGPFLDRFDLMLHVFPSRPEEIRRGDGMSSARMREAVMRARAMQDERFRDSGIRYNSQMDPAMLRKYAALDKEASDLLENAFMKNGMSVRAYNRVLRVARTIADLEARQQVTAEDVAEAVSYRMQEGFSMV